MSAALLAAVPLAPLAAAALALALARRRPNLCGFVALGGIAVSLAALLALTGEDPRIEASWFSSGGLALTAGLQLDALSRLMAWLVTGIALPVGIYALGYMAGERGRGQFFAMLSFFVGAMLTLVMASSLALLFAAWEAVGLASFMLVAFHYRDETARRAAQRVFLLTRVGDAGLLLAWLAAWPLAGTTRIAALLALVEAGGIAGGTLTLLAFLFLAGAVGKSAQLPLTAWLPHAMAGPAPVSALIHSATMVAAGVYLVLRLYPLFAAAPGALDAVLWIGAATALFSALVATAQSELKRVLAWSTSSQLGEMMLAAGLAGPLAAAYHLATHATFKSALFLCAGAVEHATGVRRLDRRHGLRRALPLAAVVFAIAALALAGVPPLSGFWSAERIAAFAHAHGPGWITLLLALIVLAGLYIGRAAALVFGGRKAAANAGEAPLDASMKLGMMALGIAAAASGWLLAGSLERALSFAAAPALGAPWRFAGALCAVAGLALGAWRAHAAGPAPALGSRVLLLERALEAVTEAPGRAAFACARAIDRVERGLDAAARGAAGFCVIAAAGVRRTDALLDTAARAGAGAAMASAHSVQRVETQILSAWIDRAAALVDRAGAAMRRVQTGELYAYTLGLFLWVLAVCILAALALR